MDIHSILFLVLCHCWPLSFAARHQDENDGWQDWKKRNNVVIPFQAVDNFRRNIWAQNKAAVEAHNSQGRRRFDMELDEMAPLTPEEYAAFRLGAIIPSSEEGRRGRKPTSQRRLDYRTLGYVTRVKNQGWCGSCWAFSTTGSIEGQYFKKTGQLISLSEQHLVDCSRARGFSYGCYGGWMGRAMQFVKNYGIHLEENYPYVFWHRQCKQDRGPVATKIKSHVRVRNDEDALADALREVGPISVAVNAGRPSFRFYKSAGALAGERVAT
ncbi:procathepsin L-like isoform X2 [Sardina pilchardus]|uniref:procathepsin L-like isoform X2 n=1 Tax=Sardina pilchardus TaxID=27697 RepID=UPI002E163359